MGKPVVTNVDLIFDFQPSLFRVFVALILFGS